jgi:hypothetical protein
MTGTPTPPAREEDLARVRAAVWSLLDAATRGRDHPWRLAVLATTGPDGPDARTVVLRECDTAARVLTVYTDLRSPKVAQLRADPRATVVCWAPGPGWQVRLSVRAEVIDQGLDVSSRWARLRLTRAAQDYLSPLPPGQRREAPGHALAQAQAADAPTPHAHFGLVRLHVQAIDWLELHPAGHRRARLSETDAVWLAP